jgi:endonuclease-3
MGNRKSSPKPGVAPARSAAAPTKPGSPKQAGSARLPGKSDESLPDRTRRAARIIAGLKTLYPEATCALHHRSPLELLISTILSAQSTDETVNKVTPVLFERYPTAEALATADPADVERIIHATGFFRQKTKSVIGACRVIVEQFNGQVPDTMETLITLPGVARKTANVVLGTWFGKNEGVVVDTHIGRLSHRLGLTWTSKNEKDAVKIEQDLMQVLPRDEWTYTGHALIWHGRRICTARKPKCGECVLNTLCPSAFTFDK